MQHYLSDSRSLHWEPWRTSLIIFLPSLSSSLQPSRGTGSAEPISGSWRPHWRRGAKLGLGRDSMLPWRGESRVERARSPASASNGGLKPCRSVASRLRCRQSGRGRPRRRRLAGRWASPVPRCPRPRLSGRQALVRWPRELPSPTAAAQHGRDSSMAAQPRRRRREGGGRAEGGGAPPALGPTRARRIREVREWLRSGWRGFAIVRIEDKAGERSAPNHIRRARLHDRSIRWLTGQRVTWHNGLPAFSARIVYGDSSHLCQMTLFVS